MLEFLEGGLRIFVAVPGVEIVDALVEIVPREEVGIAVGRGPERGLAHSIPASRY